MKNFLVFLPISIILLLTSCAGQNWKSISSDMVWQKDNKISFSIELGNEGKRNIDLLIRHNVHYAFENIPVHIKIKGPSVDYAKTLDIPIKDDSGLFKGEALGDIIDISYRLPLSISKMGKYTLEFSNGATEALFDVMEVGYKLESDEVSAD